MAQLGALAQVAITGLTRLLQRPAAGRPLLDEVEHAAGAKPLDALERGIHHAVHPTGDGAAGERDGAQRGARAAAPAPATGCPAPRQRKGRLQRP
jgi:hypothetical protein